MLYLVRGSAGYLLVDCGTWAHYWSIRWALWRQGVRPSQVTWIVITHEHPDHVGALRKLRTKHGCRVLCHALANETLRTGHVAIPQTRNRLGQFCALIGRGIRWLLRYGPVDADMVVSADTSLGGLGFPARLVPTPGHSEGSLSVVLDSGEACVGDLMADRRVPPPGPPLFGHSLDLLYESWRELLRRGVHTFWPGHGSAISADKVRAWLAEAGEPAE